MAWLWPKSGNGQDLAAFTPELPCRPPPPQAWPWARWAPGGSACATHIATIPHAHAVLFVLGVLALPASEEFIFRGLVFRALDGAWGGWRAVLGSAGLFALYHPVDVWGPMFLLGVATAVAYRRTGGLAASVVLHTAYGLVALW